MAWETGQRSTKQRGAMEQGDDRRRDPARTRREILDVATREFADRGYDGARVDEIAERTRTTKRMIYYYFGGKRQLYVEVLERAYARIREAEHRLNLDHLPPADAIRRLAEFTFDHHEANPDFIRLVSIENIHRAEHIAQLDSLAALNSPAIKLIEQILKRGQAEGVFRGDVDAFDVHLAISAYCFFRIANRYTLTAIFEQDPVDPARRDHFRRLLGDMIVSHLLAGGSQL
ncbi:TetR family transcriptional regulator [Dactylosporangium sp. NBC_01737]|uniref:TetR/AcrR family transcriptional regulator n=1 Tax=Dactylosporangium sp. NBC_01737 TaxID=2975959 RepID=UPI002E0F7836|nr:TetR family transcriptional regulator [Dactylosporangium sp. NBC_01737]